VEGRRAAWLDHEISWIEIPSLFELERLGLSAVDVVLIEDQVDLTHDDETGDGIITVKNIEIVAMDRQNRQLSYRIRGSTRFAQPWDVGGTNLSPGYDRAILR
jgi:hypothetical protein